MNPAFLKALGGLLIAGVIVTASADQARAEPLTEMRIGVLRLASQAPFFIGVERGYFREAGIDARLVFFDAAVPATVAIVSRDVDLSVIGFTPAFFNLAAHGGVKVIAGHSREMPGFPNTGIFASDAAYRAGVRTMPDIAGRRIGLTTLGSTNHYAVGRIAEKYGFDLDRSPLVPAQGLGNLAAMLIGNRVDVAAGAGTAFMSLIESGQAHIIGWAGDEVPWQLGGLATSQRVIDGKRDALQAVIDVYSRGAREYAQWLLDRDADGRFRDPGRANELLEIISAYTAMPPDVIAASLSYIDPRLDVGSVLEVASWFGEQRMIDARMDVSEFIDLSFVEGHENLPATLRQGR